jgi:hypothetical protein
MEEKNLNQNQTLHIILFVVFVLIISPLLNTFLLERVLFPGSSFHLLFLGFFTIIESFVLAWAVHMNVILKEVKSFFRFSISKKEDPEDSFPRDLKKYSVLVLPVSLLLGFGSAIIAWFMTDGFSFGQCLVRMISLSLTYGLLYRYYWNKGYLTWFDESIYGEDTL